MRKSLPTAAAAMLSALLLAGCAGSPDPAPSSSAPPSTASATPSATPSASPSPSGTDDASSGSGVPRCLADDLSGTAQTAEGGGAAGSFGIDLVLMNEGADSCYLQGWPGVSFVGGGDGTQLGAAAVQNRDGQYSSDDVVLEPGGSAFAPVMVEQALNSSNADCQPRDADGFRVYPPGNEDSLFIESDGLVACTTDIELLEVGPMQQG